MIKCLLQFSVILFLLSFCYIVLKHFKHRFFVTLFNTSSIDIVTYCIRWFSEMYMYIIHSGPSHFFSFKYKCRALLNCQSWNLKVYLHTNTESIYWPICLYICEMWWLGCEQMNRTLFYMLMYRMYQLFFFFIHVLVC